MGAYSGPLAKGHNIEGDWSDIRVRLQLCCPISGKILDDQDVCLSGWYCFGALGPSVR